MQIKPTSLPLAGQLLFATGSAGFTMLERLILLYMPFYYLPPAELNLENLIPEGTYFGIITALGAALLIGRLFDGFADPIIASLSDNKRSNLGRRKFFLLLGGLPLATLTLLVFFPPHLTALTPLNGLWLGLCMALFYLSFTTYVNPYLALLPELGHNNALRINLSTLIAFFGLLGMVLVAILFPIIASNVQATGVEIRTAYRQVIMIFTALSAVLLYTATLGFDEKRHCLPVITPKINAWLSLRQTYKIKAFRIFLCGELFLQFAMNLVTLGLIYYAVVIFQREERFMTVLAALTIGGALLFFPLVNLIAKKVGKKKVITTGVLSLTLSGLTIFIFSFNMTGIYFYLSMAMFVLAGFPLAVLTILINPTIADLARADNKKTGLRREAMFFGARAIPLKLTIALAGVVFAYLLSAFGKDIAQSLGVQLSALVVALAAACSFVFFNLYPEKEVMKELGEETG